MSAARKTNKPVVTRDALIGMAQKCARVSDTRDGDPLLDTLGELLEATAFRIADLEERIDRWERFGKTVREHLPPESKEERFR